MNTIALYIALFLLGIGTAIVAAFVVVGAWLFISFVRGIMTFDGKDEGFEP